MYTGGQQDDVEWTYVSLYVNTRAGHAVAMEMRPNTSPQEIRLCKWLSRAVVNSLHTCSLEVMV